MKASAIIYGNLASLQYSRDRRDIKFDCLPPDIIQRTRNTRKSNFSGSDICSQRLLLLNGIGMEQSTRLADFVAKPS